ncbi:MAG: ABC transporter substrate-binding protein [Anaerolineaceae bacterium]|nr:MAG: ABC transporter substrate-binding protein [Anaerolineaceae bacterium]
MNGILHKGKIATCILMLVLTCSACSQTVATPEDRSSTQESIPIPTTEIQTIVVGLVEAPTSLDPADHRERQSETVIRNMFDGLVTRDIRSGVQLELASVITFLDQNTLEVKLRRGVLFHDGVEMTADDVVFTFERIIHEDAIEYPEPHTSLRKGLINPLDSIEKIDDFTVVMHFSSAWPPAMQMLVHQQIVPKHYLEEVGTQGFLEHPIGTGPFKFVSAEQDLSEIIMERFDDYYGGAPGLPPVGPACVDRVIFRVIPDAMTRAAALKAGEVTIIQEVPLDLIEVLSEGPDISVRTAPGTRPVWLDLNVNMPPFTNVRVRQALNYAVDKEEIIREVFFGRAIALPGPLSPYNNFVNKDLEPYPYDPERALSLLTQAGWIDMNGDGFPDREGEPFDLTIDTLERWRPLAENIASQLQRIGIRTTIRYWDRSVIRPYLLAGERMAFLEGWGDSAFDPVGHFEAKWHTYIEDQPYGRGNYSGYSNERVDSLIKLGETTPWTPERERIYNEAQMIIYVDSPAVFLILPEEIGAASTRIQNWELASDGRINLHDVCIIPVPVEE